MSLIGRKAVGPLAAQFRPLTESGPEYVSCLAHTGEAGAYSVRAARRRKGHHTTARVLRPDVCVFIFVRRFRDMIWRCRV